MENQLVEVVSPIDDPPAARLAFLPATSSPVPTIRSLPVLRSMKSLRNYGATPEGSVKLDIQRASLLQPIAKTPTREIHQSAFGSLLRRRGCRWLIRISEFNNLAGDELIEAIQHISSEVPAEPAGDSRLSRRSNLQHARQHRLRSDAGRFGSRCRLVATGSNRVAC